MSLPASLTVDALKLRIDKRTGGDDTLLQGYLEAAFEQAQAPDPLGCGRLLAPDPALVDGDDTAAAVQKTIEVSSRHVLIPDAREITEVLVDDVAVTDFHPVTQDELVVALTLPHDQSCRAWGGYSDGCCDCRWFYGRRPRVVKVTGRFGFLTIPPNLLEAIYTLAARMYYEREAQFADQVAVADGGGVQAYYRQLPPRVKLAFASYAPPAGLAGLP